MLYIVCPLGCPSTGENMIRCPLRCSSSGENVIQCALSARWCPFNFFHPHPSYIPSPPLQVNVCSLNLISHTEVLSISMAVRVKHFLNAFFWVSRWTLRHLLELEHGWGADGSLLPGHPSPSPSSFLKVKSWVKGFGGLNSWTLQRNARNVFKATALWAVSKIHKAPQWKHQVHTKKWVWCSQFSHILAHTERYNYFVLIVLTVISLASVTQLKETCRASSYVDRNTFRTALLTIFTSCKEGQERVIDSEIASSTQSQTEFSSEYFSFLLIWINNKLNRCVVLLWELIKDKHKVFS